ncbi:lactonase family protein [Solimicrobium silvestre]|uniref:Lactonase, 7-bladed beta-propeller n=1 Tax=Solimicrobium silvestre TaxID=2099400 RepID=A0A2S9GZP4_9BURK|nr:beta-propeller fold lactonase family protein [Solimicrobium silvestre]PRC93205.1 Lactonase, 7-bladed beta-propeller [Solimicrobium silvestre]
MKHSPQLSAPRILGGITISCLLAALSACGGSSSSTPATTSNATAPVIAPPLANQLYTQSNETANVIVHFSRSATGAITVVDRTSTGGVGTNGIKSGGAPAAPGPDTLASQHSVIISPDKSTLFAVNAGDNSISVFAINQTTGSLTLEKNTSTNGLTPNSLAFNNGYLYVTFQGGSDQLGAYQVGSGGGLTQVGLYSLAVAGAAPNQVVISPNGSFVVVSAGHAANAIVSYPINGDGSLATPIVNVTGNTPFAGAFMQTASNWVYLSTNIGGMGLGSFSFSTSGALTAIASGTSGVAAPCWLSITPNNQFAYVGNGAGAISSYSVTTAGAVSLLSAQAATEPSAITGVNSVAADSWVSPDGLYLYSDYLGDDKVVAYSISSTGVLTKINQAVLGTATGLSMQGLVGI